MPGVLGKTSGAVSANAIVSLGAMQVVATSPFPAHLPCNPGVSAPITSPFRQARRDAPSAITSSTSSPGTESTVGVAFRSDARTTTGAPGAARAGEIETCISYPLALAVACPTGSPAAWSAGGCVNWGRTPGLVYENPPVAIAPRVGSSTNSAALRTVSCGRVATATTYAQSRPGSSTVSASHQHSATTTTRRRIPLVMPAASPDAPLREWARPPE